MDTMKLEMYLRALDLIKSEKETFVCTALCQAYEEIAGGPMRFEAETLYSTFHEFFDLWDGSHWYYARRDDEYLTKVDEKHAIDEAWWDQGAYKARESALMAAIRACA